MSMEYCVQLREGSVPKSKERSQKGLRHEGGPPLVDLVPLYR